MKLYLIALVLFLALLTTIKTLFAQGLPAFGAGHIYLIEGNLTVSGNNSGTQSGVVFVDGNLTFTGNYCYGATGATTGAGDNCSSASSPSGTIGAVFIVRGDLNIAPSVTRIDAVLISEGIIYTAGAGCSLPAPATPGTNSQLVINGSLISLKQPPITDPNASYIRFCRKLSNNTLAAEIINHQPKYVVILRHLLSDTLQRWSEIP